ncbi:hypothetical protein FB451DRAFT_1395573 [Mycena latifolia]|nr:hypothetical protein FB451DRAFT_1395573 [Mycena latifolia]
MNLDALHPKKCIHPPFHLARPGHALAYVALRKKSTNERNIKLTVMLMASQRMLGALHGLDSHAALFGLSLVSQAELGDFVKRCARMLVIMFGSTAILPPRTKRWAEAKVLADCINSSNEHTLALSHHNTDIRKFGDFSRGRGDVRVLKLGCEAKLHPRGAPQARHAVDARHPGTPPLPRRPPTVPPASVFEKDAMRRMGINPSHALQHPGPKVMNEKNVDHLIIILELYTKAYELFKKFFERMAKSYRREKWGLLLRQLLATWYACARQLGDVERSIQLLVEMLGYSVEEADYPASLEEDLFAVLKVLLGNVVEDPVVKYMISYTRCAHFSDEL